MHWADQKPVPIPPPSSKTKGPLKSLVHPFFFYMKINTLFLQAKTCIFFSVGVRRALHLWSDRKCNVRHLQTLGTAVCLYGQQVTEEQEEFMNYKGAHRTTSCLAAVEVGTCSSFIYSKISEWDGLCGHWAGLVFQGSCFSNKLNPEYACNPSFRRHISQTR